MIWYKSAHHDENNSCIQSASDSFSQILSLFNAEIMPEKTIIRLIFVHVSKESQFCESTLHTLYYCNRNDH